MLTWTARGALNVTTSVTGQENALPPGIAHILPKILIQLLQNQSRSPRPIQCKVAMLDEEVADIAKVHCDSELFEIEFVLVRRVSTSKEIFVEA